MFHHLELLFGPVWAVAAAERQLAGVAEAVMPEPGRPAEAPPTHGTDVGPLIVVPPLVSPQQETRFKGFAAFLADERSGVSVPRHLVDTQGVGPVRPVLAFRTGVRFNSCYTTITNVTKDI